MAKPPSPAFQRWSKVLDRAYAADDNLDREGIGNGVIAEFHRRMEAAGQLHFNPGGEVTDARYDFCADIMLAILEPKVTLDAQADEYEECMRAQEIMEGL